MGMTNACRRARILLVEDDAGVVHTVNEALSGPCFAVETADTLDAAQARIRDRSFDALILDLNLPDGDGLDLAATLRGDGVDIPIVMLTARVGVADRVAGFARGADDYVCKPFAPLELAARLRAVMRRSQPDRSHLLRYGGAELDLLTRTVQFGGMRVSLSDREASLLAYLLRHPEEPIPREVLAQEVFGLDADGDTGVVNVYVNYLRNKLEHGRRDQRLIHTVRGTGYMLSAAQPRDGLRPEG